MTDRPQHKEDWTGFCRRCGQHMAMVGWAPCLSDTQLKNVIPISHIRRAIVVDEVLDPSHPIPHPGRPNDK